MPHHRHRPAHRTLCLPLSGVGVLALVGALAAVRDMLWSVVG